MIEFKNITKKFGKNKALNDVSFQIDDGHIFGLIGHNGAGKTTAINILVSILNETSGDIIIDGELLKNQRDEIKKEIGYVADSPNLFLRLQA